MIACPNLCGPAMSEPRRPAPAQIILEVARKRGVTVEEILSGSRVKRISHARQEVMAELRKRTRLSFPQIAAKLGLKDHSSVMHGVRAHESRAA
jgi:chromosomal replication initiator protein